MITNVDIRSDTPQTDTRQGKDPVFPFLPRWRFHRRQIGGGREGIRKVVSYLAITAAPGACHRQGAQPCATDRPPPPDTDRSGSNATPCRSPRDEYVRRPRPGIRTHSNPILT